MPDDVPWAELDPAVNTDGNLRTGGFVLDQDALGFTQFTVNLGTYPGMQALNDRNWDRLRGELYAAFPQLEKDGALEGGPESLDNFYPGLYEFYSTTLPFPVGCGIDMTPYRFHITAAATAMTREEFIEYVSEQASQLRNAILADTQASPALLTIAADEATWLDLYLASLEEGGLLRPESELPPIREQDQVVSLMATLASGILIGPAGSEIRAAGNLTEFFEQVRIWYGHEPQLAEIEKYEPRCFFSALQPVPALPSFEDYDLGLSSPTHFETLRVYVPWLEWNQRAAGLPPEFQINGPFEPVDGDEFHPLDLSGYFQAEGRTNSLASLVGPLTVDTGGYLPVGQSLPYTVQFQNDPAAQTQPGEIRVVTELDEDLEPFTFRLGDIKIGDINVHVPGNHALFQGDFDFSQAKGFVLRISAGIDVPARQATWLIQAIDPDTGEVIQDPHRGLLPPNNAARFRSGFRVLHHRAHRRRGNRRNDFCSGKSADEQRTARGHTADRASDRRRAAIDHVRGDAAEPKIARTTWCIGVPAMMQGDRV